MDLDDTAFWTAVTADELGAALSCLGGPVDVWVDEDGDVAVMFRSLAQAEMMLTLAMDGDGPPGSLYDRVTEGCVSQSASPEPMSDEAYRALRKTCWTWMIHPAMSGRRVDWHVSVSMPPADASAVTAALNGLAVRQGGAR